MGALGVVEPLEGPGVDERPAKGVVLLGGAVAPVDGGRTGQGGDLLHPGEQLAVGGQGRGVLIDHGVVHHLPVVQQMRSWLAYCRTATVKAAPRPSEDRGMDFVHYCVYCAWHVAAPGPTMLAPACPDCGCSLRSCPEGAFAAIRAEEIDDTPAERRRPDGGAWMGVFVVVAFGIPLSGVDLTGLSFAVPLVLALFTGLRCLAAARADPRLEAVWRACAAGAFLAAVSSLLLATRAFAGAPTVAFYLGAVVSCLVLAGGVVLALRTVREGRLDGLLDALVLAIVLVALAVRGVVIPGAGHADPVLLSIFAIDLIALIFSVTAAVAAPRHRDRRIGLRFSVICLAAAAGDAAVVIGGASGSETAAWTVAVGWSIALYALASAATIALEPPRPEPDDLATRRRVAARVVLPFLAASALPVAGFSRAALPGELPAWEFLYFGTLSVVVLALAFGRQGYLLLDNARAMRRERTLREESQYRNEELEALTGLATTMTQSLEETPIVEQSLEVLHLAARASSSALHLSTAPGGFALAATAGAWQGEQPWTRPRGGGRHAGRVPRRPADHPSPAERARQRPRRRDLRAARIGPAARGGPRAAAPPRRPARRRHPERPGLPGEARTGDPRPADRPLQPALLLRGAREGGAALGALRLLGVADPVRRRRLQGRQRHLRPRRRRRGPAPASDPWWTPCCARDSFARIGGEEFAVLLPETHALDALMVADRMRTALGRAPIVDGRRVTVSGGVGSCPADASTREELLRLTDAALYWSKRNGKDICALAGEATDGQGIEGPADDVAKGAHLYGLVASIDGQSRYTRDHSDNVAAYASALGRQLGLDRERVIVLRRAALLHDIGKVAVPEGILSKRAA
jgi:hypothetical protein